MTIERATWLTTDKDRNAARALADLASGGIGMWKQLCDTCHNAPWCAEGPDCRDYVKADLDSRRTGMDEPKCVTCLYNNQGACHRYPKMIRIGFWCGEYKPKPCEATPLESAAKLVGETYGFYVRTGDYGDGSLREQHHRELLAEAARLRGGGKPLPGGFNFSGQGERIEPKPEPSEIKHPAECCETCRSFSKYPEMPTGECGFAVAMGYKEHDVRRSDSCRWHKPTPAAERQERIVCCDGVRVPLPKGLVE